MFIQAVCLPSPRPSLASQLAAAIAASAAELDTALAAQGVPSPSFDENDANIVPDEAVDAQDAILDAAGELIDLLHAPLASLYLHGAHNANVPLQFIPRFCIADLVPAGGKTSYASIADKISVKEHLVRRLLHYAMTMCIFCEPGPNMVAHTRISKALADPALPLNEWLRVGTHEMWPASVKVTLLPSNKPKKLTSPFPPRCWTQSEATPTCPSPTKPASPCPNPHPPLFTRCSAVLPTKQPPLPAP